MNSALRHLPAVHRLIDEPALASFIPRLGAGAVKGTIADVLDEARRLAVGSVEAGVPPYDAFVERIAERLTQHEAAGLLPVLNGTGILLHTNLGRAPLAREALDAMATIGGAYSNLEFDLESGTRGSRYDRAGALLRETTGAPDALIVNNCAAAILLVLDTYAKDREVVVSRGELIEIGGGFRLPDVLARSGARLIEVGTTNRVSLHDVERALTADTALLLRSHPSNFRITGFVAGIDGAELSALGRRAAIPTVEDLGTGALIDLASYGLPHERTVREAIADGLDLVAFSGDKLLGGPQCGIIAGNCAAIARLRANPLLRALRVDKATLAALTATLALYTVSGGMERIPLYGMLALTFESLVARAEQLRSSLGAAAATTQVIETAGYVGGGTLPDVTIRSAGLAIEPPDGDADSFARRLRRDRPAIVGRLKDRSLILDLRTLPAANDELLARRLATALAGAA